MPQTSMNQFISNFSSTICGLTTNRTYSNVIFLCIGTDRVTGDSFGPIVGYKLKKFFRGVQNVQIIGDLENTVCNDNIEQTINSICKQYSNPFIISIDSALSKNSDNVGKIIVGKGGIILGSSIRRERYVIGDMYIKGITARDFCNSRKNFSILQNTRLNIVIQMADVVANGIYESIEIIKWIFLENLEKMLLTRFSRRIYYGR